MFIIFWLAHHLDLCVKFEGFKMLHLARVAGRKTENCTDFPINAHLCNSALSPLFILFDLSEFREL